MKLLLIVTLICLVSIASSQTILGLIQNNTQLSVLSANITANDPSLASTLNGAGNFTYLGPTNTAMNNLGTLNSTGLYPNIATTLSYHGANGNNLLVSLPPYSFVASLATGFNLYITNYTGTGLSGGVTVNGAQIASITNATNGVLGIIGTVLFPPMGNNLATLARLSAYTEANAFFGRADTATQNIINGAGKTLFVPNNQAFVTFNQTLIAAGTNLSSLNQSTINAFCLNHVLNFTFPAFFVSFPTTATPLATAYQANGVTTTSTGTAVSISSAGNPNSGSIVNADLVTTNGVVHTVNTFLEPSGFFPVPTPTPGPTVTPSPTTTGATTGATTGTTSDAVSLKVPVLIFALIALLFALF